jgi:hypothetical protein
VCVCGVEAKCIVYLWIWDLGSSVGSLSKFAGEGRADESIHVEFMSNFTRLFERDRAAKVQGQQYVGIGGCIALSERSS